MIIPKRVISIDTPKIDLDMLEEALDKLSFKECSPAMEESWGFFFVDELEAMGPKLRRINPYAIMNLRHDRKKINKSRLSRAWNKEIREVEKKEKIVLDKARRKELRDKVKHSLLKEIHADDSYIKAVFNSLNNRLYLLISEPATVEFFVDKLNRALEPQDIKLRYSADTISPFLQDTLTQWVATTESAVEQGFSVGDDMQLKGAESSSATLKHHNAESAEVREHLHADKDIHKVKLLTKIADENEALVSMMLHANGVISQIDLKPYCGEIVKSERENHTDVEAMKESEFLVWMNALAILVQKVLAIKTV